MDSHTGKKAGFQKEKMKGIDIFKGYGVGEAEASPVQIADYQKIQYEEILKEMQRDTKTLSQAIVQTYLEMLGESDTYEGRKEREKLESLAPTVVLELVTKRFENSQAQIQEQINALEREDKRNKDKDEPEMAIDLQMQDLTAKNAELQRQLQQMKERVDGLMKACEDERKLRIEAAVHSRAIVESIKEDKKKIVKIIADKDNEINVIKEISGEKEKLKKKIEESEQTKEQLKMETKLIEKKYKEEIAKLEEEHSHGFENLGKKLESKRTQERQAEQEKRESEMDAVEKQLQKESETDKQMAKRLGEIQGKLAKQKQKELELEEKDKVESREKERLRKELELLKKKNNELSKAVKNQDYKLKNDVKDEAARIYTSIRSDIEKVLLSKTKQDDYVEDVLSSHKRLSMGMKDMIVKERELNAKLQTREKELAELKNHHFSQRTKLWQEKPIKKKDIKVLKQLFSQSTKAIEPRPLSGKGAAGKLLPQNGKKNYTLQKNLESDVYSGMDNFFRNAESNQ